MKLSKILALLLSICMVLSLVACGSGDDSNKESIEEESQETNSTIDEKSNIFIEETKNDVVIVTVVEKKNIPKNISEGRYSDRVEFTFNVENLTAKSIKGIQGTLIVKDLFDNTIISIGCDFTGKNIPANNTTTFKDIGIDINQFMDNQTKLYSEKYEDLKFTYEVGNIVYSSDASNSQQIQTDNGTNSNVKVEVTDKYNRGKDYSVGRYSDRVEFSFRITNTGSKSIKGVQGILIVKDLFQKTIISINCDFTGNTISENNYIIVSDLGIDINPFMDDQIKLYGEKYEDLNFEYKVQSIVYTDGSIDNFD